MYWKISEEKPNHSHSALIFSKSYVEAKLAKLGNPGTFPVKILEYFTVEHFGSHVSRMLGAWPIVFTNRVCHSHCYRARTACLQARHRAEVAEPLRTPCLEEKLPAFQQGIRSASAPSPRDLDGSRPCSGPSPARPVQLDHTAVRPADRDFVWACLGRAAVSE